MAKQTTYCSGDLIDVRNVPGDQADNPKCMGIRLAVKIGDAILVRDQNISVKSSPLLGSQNRGINDLLFTSKLFYAQ